MCLLHNTVLAHAERRRLESDSYKDLFAEISGNGYQGLLRRLETKMMGLVLDACTAIENKTGKPLNKDAFNILAALPYICMALENDISAKDGRACCVDKTYYLLDEIIAEMAIVEPTTPTTE